MSRLMALRDCLRLGRARPLCPGISDVKLFRYRESIIHLNTEISDSAFDLRVAEQKLYRSQVNSAPVDQRCLCPSDRMGAKELGIETDAGDPVGDKPCVLARRHTL